MILSQSPEPRQRQTQRPESCKRNQLQSMISKTKSSTSSPSLSITSRSRNPNHYRRSKTYLPLPPPPPSPLVSNHIKFEELRVIRGKKLLKDLSTWGIGGPSNHFLQVFTSSQLLSALRSEVSTFFFPPIHSSSSMSKVIFFCFVLFSFF